MAPMSVSQATTVSATHPTRFGLHSVEGFGKTTLAQFFPRPITIAKKHSFPRDLPFRPISFPEIETWEQVFEAVESLRVDDHDRETAIIDTANELESLCWRFCCDRDSNRKTEMNKGGNKLINIEDYGYGRGYTAAKVEFQRLLEALDRLQHDRKMHIVILLHSEVKKFENPNGLNYDRWQPRMHEKSARLITEWVENLFFGFYEVEAGKLSDEKKAKGVSTGRRMLGTRYNAMYDAKNRMNLPETVELKQPDDMIPYLLGEHLQGEEPPTQRTREESAPAKPEPKAEPKKAESKGVDFSKRTKAGQKASEKKSEPAPKEEPKAEATPETVSETREDSTAETEEKPTWLNPKGKAENELIRQCYDAMMMAKELGEKYETKIRKWAKSAEGDHEKIRQLCELVITDYEQIKADTKSE